MGARPERKEIPLWIKSPDDLRDPEVFQVPTWQLVTIFGPNGSRIPCLEQMSKTVLELKFLESSSVTKIELQAKWMLESLAQWHRHRQDRGMLKCEEAMNGLELDLGFSEASS
ncbi:developmental pluripotency-associated 5 protein-like [Echinops telfairi]|uniref:Developmental pluripotency-associated 5 protein-like n=1 Tax=Echinops telfairi TaxID=9371 RepID=A0ABM0IEP1_ECHTE|nr:developmental pluripotency-associated 5 protein-like [Echinops telfairi]